MKLYKQALIFTRLLKTLAVLSALTYVLVTYCGLCWGKRQFTETGCTTVWCISFMVCFITLIDSTCVSGRVPSQLTGLQSVWQNQTSPIWLYNVFKREIVFTVSDTFIEEGNMLWWCGTSCTLFLSVCVVCVRVFVCVLVESHRNCRRCRWKAPRPLHWWW